MFMDRMTHYHDGHSSNRILASLSSAPAAAPSAKSCGVRVLLRQLASSALTDSNLFQARPISVPNRRNSILTVAPFQSPCPRTQLSLASQNAHLSMSLPLITLPPFLPPFLFLGHLMSSY